jgi:hypothetical protein
MLMASSHPSHHLVAIGMSAVPQLPFPAKNARDFFHVFTSALGPPNLKAACLIDRQASRAAVGGVFDEAVRAPPKYFVVYFSGAAGTRGLKLADGLLSPRVLGSYLGRVQSAAILLVLDVTTPFSNTGEPQFAAWIDSLPAELPHVRIAIARATAVADGDPGCGGSRFTTAYIRALHGSGGDMQRMGDAYVSDRRAFDAATEIMRRRWDERDLPVESGLFGGMPLVRSEAVGAVGAGRIKSLSEGQGLSLRVQHALDGRRHVPTVVHSLLVDASDEPLVERTATVVPDADKFVGRTLVRVGPQVLREHTIWGPLLDMGETLVLRWRVKLRNVFGHVLDQQVLEFAYRRDR